MENLQLILTTVLITLFSVAVVGIISYLVVVVRRLKGSVKDNTLDISIQQQLITDESNGLNQRINNLDVETLKLLNDLENQLSRFYDELDRKIDSRFDKALNLINDVQSSVLELAKQARNNEELKKDKMIKS